MHRGWELPPAPLPARRRLWEWSRRPLARGAVSAPSRGLDPRQPLTNPTFHLPSPSPRSPEAGREEQHKPRRGSPCQLHPVPGCAPGPGGGKPQRARCDPKGTCSTWDQLVNLSRNRPAQVPPPLPRGLRHTLGSSCRTLGVKPPPRQGMWGRASAPQPGSDSSADFRRTECVFQQWRGARGIGRGFPPRRPYS